MKNAEIKAAAEKASLELKKGNMSMEDYSKYLLSIPKIEAKTTVPQLPVINENK